MRVRGVVVSIAVGFIGALFGSMIAAHFHLPELLMVSVEGRGFPILWSIIGAALFVAVVHLISGPRRSTPPLRLSNAVVVTSLVR